MSEEIPIGRLLTITCAVCGKATAGGRLPREDRHTPGDGSERFPRRHKVDGEDCPGNIVYGLWSDGPHWQDK